LWGDYGHTRGYPQVPGSRGLYTPLDHWCPGACGTFRTDPFFVIFLIGRSRDTVQACWSRKIVQKKSVKKSGVFCTPKRGSRDPRFRPRFWGVGDPQTTPGWGGLEGGSRGVRTGSGRGSEGHFFQKPEKVVKPEAIPPKSRE
jgi:hypothetical protein